MNHTRSQASEDVLLTPLEVAEQLHMHRDTVYKLLRSNEIGNIRPRGRWLVPQSAVDAFLMGGAA